jgi:outer membrane receptor protein involved in Fe transport
MATMASAIGAHAQTAPEAAAVQEIVVTGSRLQTSGFTTPTPVTVVGAERLQTRAPSTIGEALQEIPAFRPAGGGTQGTGGTFTVGQTVLDLRGLGPTRTLVLVDGRRHVPNQTNGTFDTNVVPTALIDRTEVVTGGASAAYGSDAVAGVVNIVLNNRLSGFKGNVQYGVSEIGDNQEWSGSLAYGAALLDNRLHIIVGGDLSTADPAGNMYSRDWGRRETNILPLTTARAAGLPANVVADYVESTFGPGGVIVACTQAGILRSGPACPFNNLTFTNTGQTVPFAFQGGLVGSNQAQGPGSNYGYSVLRNQYIRVGGDRYSALARADFDVTEDVNVFAEFSAGEFQVNSRSLDYTTNSNNIIVLRNNPYLPAALAASMDAAGVTQIRMNRLNYGSRDGVDITNTNEFKQGVAGIKGKLPGDWSWDAYVMKGRGKLEYNIGGLTHMPNYFAAAYAVTDATGKIVCGPVATNPMLAALTPATARSPALVSPGCVPLNPFGPTSVSDEAFTYANPRVQQFTAFDRTTAAINLSGEPFSTWAGPVSLAVGAEYRKDEVNVTVPPLIQQVALASGFFASNPTSGAGEMTVKEAYGEIGVPLLRGAAFAKSVDLNGAVRLTDYSTTGGVTTWKVGGTWEVNDILRFRVTRSRDIRAPNIPDLFLSGNDGLNSRTNPLNGQTATVVGRSAPNPNLRPEKADTWTVGSVVRFNDGALSGFRASVDYYTIEINDVIASISPQELLNRYYLQGQTEYARYFNFDSSPIGFSRLDTPVLNLNRQKTDGVDIELAYRVPTDFLPLPGQISISALGTWLDDLDTLDQNGVSLGDIAGAIPEWRWTGTIGYEQARFRGSLQAKYNSSVKFRTTLVGPNDVKYNPAAANSINDNLFPDAVYFSATVQYQVLKRERGDVRLYAVVDNILDKDPPAGSWSMLTGQGNGGSGGYNPYDAVGRSFKFGLRFQY